MNKDYEDYLLATAGKREKLEYLHQWIVEFTDCGFDDFLKVLKDARTVINTKVYRDYGVVIGGKSDVRWDALCQIVQANREKKRQIKIHAKELSDIMSAIFETVGHKD